MDENAFEGLASATLARLAERIEDAIGDDADVDLRGGILTVELADGSQFVVNKHGPNRQIWLSSPVSGASHYGWSGTDWLSTRGGQRLETVLSADLAGRTGAALDLG
jgi:frataxin